MKLKAQDLIGIGIGTMMRVMEQRTETKALLAGQYFIHHLRFVPFVNDDQIGVGKLVIEKSRKVFVTLVEANVEFRIYDGNYRWIPAAAPSSIRLLRDQASISS